MGHEDLLDSAKFLLNRTWKKPRQTDLRRSQSTIYYALFHALAKACADLMIGHTAVGRSKHAWRQVYRALEHGVAKQQCSNRIVMAKFPKAIEDFASVFIQMQAKRHLADYDPDFRTTKSEVLRDHVIATQAIHAFRDEAVKDRRAFAAWVLLKPKR